MAVSISIAMRCVDGTVTAITHPVHGVSLPVSATWQPVRRADRSNFYLATSDNAAIQFIRSLFQKSVTSFLLYRCPIVFAFFKRKMFFPFHPKLVYSSIRNL